MNVQGFYQGRVFHPIRSSPDYDPGRAGEKYIQSGYAKQRGRRSGKPGRKRAMRDF